MDDYTWVHDVAVVDLEELSRLYRIAPLGDKPPEALSTVFGNSMFTCLAYANGVLLMCGCHRLRVALGVVLQRPGADG